MPPLPLTVHDIDFAAVNQVWSETKRGSQFMFKHDTNFGITIFTTLKQLEILVDSRCRYVGVPRGVLMRFPSDFLGAPEVSCGCAMVFAWF